MEEFEPKIMGFVCNSCSYAGVDLSGLVWDNNPPDIRVVRVMCSGRVDPAFIIEALRSGTEGVIVLGCHNCQHVDGNFEEEQKFLMLEKLLEIIGLEKRVLLDWVSASEDVKFEEIIQEFTDHIKSLGPNTIQDEENEDLIEQIDAIGRVVNDPRIRTMIGRERKITTQENVYGKVLDKEYFDQLLEEALFDEFVCQRMLIKMENGPASVKEMADRLQIKSNRVLRFIEKLKGNGSIDNVISAEIDEATPYYQTITQF
jgi:F420-non-reducing hydrogenase iron-sulfur subunit